MLQVLSDEQRELLLHPQGQGGRLVRLLALRCQSAVESNIDHCGGVMSETRHNAGQRTLVWLERRLALPKECVEKQLRMQGMRGGADRSDSRRKAPGNETRILSAVEWGQS
jgi:hypothetical protein